MSAAQLDEIRAADEGDGYIVVRRRVHLLDSPIGMTIDEGEEWRDAVNANGGEYIGEVCRVEVDPPAPLDDDDPDAGLPYFQYVASYIADTDSGREMIEHPTRFASNQAAIAFVGEQAAR